MSTVRRDDAGFTLVETAVTVVLLGVLMAFAVAGYREYAQARAQDGAATSMREVLRQAQQRAVTEGSSMCVDFTGTSYRLYRGACDAPTRTALGPAEQLEDGVRFTEAKFAVGDGTTVTGVTFRSRGTASPGTVTIRRDGSDTQRTLSVEGLTGRVVVR